MYAYVYVACQDKLAIIEKIAEKDNLSFYEANKKLESGEMENFDSPSLELFLLFPVFFFLSLFPLLCWPNNSLLSIQKRRKRKRRRGSLLPNFPPPTTNSSTHRHFSSLTDTLP